MKSYVATTGVIFALVTLAHLARTGELRGRIATDPWFVIGYTALTLSAGALAVWAWRVYARLRASDR